MSKSQAEVRKGDAWPQVELKEGVGMRIAIHNQKCKSNAVLIEIFNNKLVRYTSCC